MPKVDRSILSVNDQKYGDIADPNKLETMITHLADIIDSLDDVKTVLTGDHKGTWNGLSPSQMGNETVNGARIDSLELNAILKSGITYSTVSGTNLNGSTGIFNARKIKFNHLNISIISVYINLTNIMDAGTKGSIPSSYAPNTGKYEAGQLIVPNNAAGVARPVHVYSDGTVGVMGTSGSNYTYYGTVTYMREE